MICSSVCFCRFIVWSFPQRPDSSSPRINSRGQRQSPRDRGVPVLPMFLEAADAKLTVIAEFRVAWITQINFLEQIVGNHRLFRN
jgi:hypothetical protein